MTSPIRWGILGTGFAARNFAEGLRSVSEAKLVAVGSREISRAAAFANSYGTRAYGSYEEAAAQPDVDVLYIATTADQHKSDCFTCFDAGKPVLCEKPFALNALQASEIVAAARSKRLFCMEAMWMRFQPLVLKTRELAQSGAIGDIRLLTADFGLPTNASSGSWRFNPDRGGGALLDRGVYCLSLAFFLFGAPVAIKSESILTTRCCDEQTSITLRYAGGEEAVLAASLTSYSSNQAVICGTTGRIVMHEPFYRPHRITIAKNAPAAGSGVVSQRGLKHKLVRAVRESRITPIRRAYFRAKDCLSPLLRRSQNVVLPPVGNGYNYEAAEVQRCLRSGKLESDLMPLEETVCIMEAMDAIRLQWKDNRSADAP